MRIFRAALAASFLVAVSAAGFAAPADGSALGVFLGQPTGLTFRYGLGAEQSLEAKAAWDLTSSGKSTPSFTFQANWLLELPGILVIKGLDFPLYFGAGAQLDLGSAVALGFRVPGGALFRFPSAPIELCLELSVGMYLFPQHFADGFGRLGHQVPFLAARRRVPSRNLVYEALVLRARESPSGSRILGLMTAEAGLVDVFVFGGPKSKLRSLASPYAVGRAFVYHDPVKDLTKLSDFEVRDSFPALREDLGRLWAAGLVAELLIKTSGGGGDFPLVLGLATDTLRGLDATESGRIDYPLVLFLWRLVSLLGLGPDPSSCQSCGRDIDAMEGSAYSAQAEGFLCPDCLGHRDGHAGGGQAEGEPRPAGILPLSAGARRWLERASELPFAEAMAASLDEASIKGLRALVFGLARRAAESPLASFTQYSRAGFMS